MKKFLRGRDFIFLLLVIILSYPPWDTAATKRKSHIRSYWKQSKNKVEEYKP